MITEEDIKKIQSELTEEQWKQFVFLLTQPELIELKKTIKEKTNTKFIKVMRRYINKYIKQLNNVEGIKIETINLLVQSKLTLKNVHKLIKNKSISDANALLRSSLENIMMTMLIHYDEKTYNEFINLAIKYNKREYTKPSQIRKNFSSLMKSLDEKLFEEITNEQLEELLDDLYDNLCKFAHSSLMVNAVIEMEKDDNLDLYIVGLKQNTYFVELTLYLCLKYLCRSKKEPLDITYIGLGSFVLLSDIPKEKISKEQIDKFYSLLHSDENKDYLEKNKDKNEFLINETNKLKNTIEENPLGIINAIKEIIK